MVSWQSENSPVSVLDEEVANVEGRSSQSAPGSCFHLLDDTLIALAVRDKDKPTDETEQDQEVPRAWTDHGGTLVSSIRRW